MRRDAALPVAAALQLSPASTQLWTSSMTLLGTSLQVFSPSKQLRASTLHL
jgi:hypothetical protein